MRDIAPIFYSEDKKLKSINFEFNGYGKVSKLFKMIIKYQNLFQIILNIPTIFSDIVIEGGAITYDDKKNLI